MNIFQRKLLCYSSYFDSYGMNCKYNIEFKKYFMSQLISRITYSFIAIDFCKKVTDQKSYHNHK